MADTILSWIVAVRKRVRVDFTRLPITLYDAWAVGSDFRIAFSENIGIKGEFFHGQSLGNYNAGIMQIFDPLTLVAVRTTGGWGEVSVKWPDCWRSSFGMGLDDPLDSTLSAGLPTRNQFAFANLVCDVTKDFEVGFEVGHWRTDYTAAPALGPLALGDNEAMIYRSRVRLKF